MDNSLIMNKYAIERVCKSYMLFGYYKKFTIYHI